MRSMSPLAQSSQNSRMTTPESALISPLVPLKEKSLDPDEATDTTPKLRGNSTTSDLLAENSALKEELTDLRKNRQIILDHSIESDKRLLQFTENVFLPLPSIASLVDEIGVPASNNKLSQDVEDIHRRSYSDCATQCDFIPYASEDLMSKNKTYEHILAQNLSLQKSVEEFQSKIIALEDRNSSLQKKCDILYEESRNMINSIRAFEGDIKQKNNKINKLEEDLNTKCAKIHEINYINRKNYDTLMDYHMKYPSDNFRCLSERLLEEVRCRDSVIKTYKDKAGGISILTQELQTATSSRNDNSCNYTVLPKPSIPIHNKFSILQNATAEEPGFQTVCNHRRPKQDLRRKHTQTIFTHHPNQKAPSKKSYNNRSIFNVPFTNVSVVGDSHARYIGSLMTERISHQTKITGVCKPGAGICNIAPKTSQRTHPRTDCLVLLAGTNDVAVGRQNTIFRNFEGIVERCRQTSTVVVCSLPTRHDLPRTSPVHGVVSRVNQYLKELCNRQEGVHWLDMSDIPRKNYTTHGLHLRASGKRLLAGLIVERLASLRTMGDYDPRSVGTAQQPTYLAGDTDSIPVSSFTATSPITLPHESYAAAVSRSHTRSSSDHQLVWATNHSPVSGNMISLPETLISGGNMVNSSKNMNVHRVLVTK